jgi:hypothetical protein
MSDKTDQMRKRREDTPEMKAVTVPVAAIAGMTEKL